MTQFPQRKNIRLKRVVYNGPLTIACTIRTYREIDIIKESMVAEILKNIHSFEYEHRNKSLAYCLMPDHLHWLFRITDISMNAIDQIDEFKQKTSFKASQKSTITHLWQDRFFDHIMRTDEDVEEHAKYIFWNPVRKGIVDKANEYPYSGGEYFKLIFG